MVSNQALSQAVTPRRSRFWPTVLLIASVVFMIVMAVVGFLQLARTERVLILVRPVAYGQPISADDLATVEVSRHRPQQLAGVNDPATAIGKYAARALAPDDLLQPSMLLAAPPARPVYPSGEELGADMVAIPFSTETTGPISNTDVLNIGCYDESGDARRCVDPSEQAAQTVAAPAAPEQAAEAPDELGGTAGRAPPAAGQPYACRLLVNINVLHVDQDQATAFLELTPYQAQAIRAVQAAALPLYAERSTPASWCATRWSLRRPWQRMERPIRALRSNGKGAEYGPRTRRGSTTICNPRRRACISPGRATCARLDRASRLVASGRRRARARAGLPPRLA